MFGLFSKKQPQHTVTSEDKAWIEESLSWFLEAFGLERLKARPFIAPTFENFPYNELNDSRQFQQLFEQLCGYFDVAPDDIAVSFFDDIQSEEWTSVPVYSNAAEPAGLYTQVYTTSGQRFQIELAKSNLNHPELLVAVLAHELAHVKLLGGNYLHQDNDDMEQMTDLATIFFGFGIFMANSVHTQGRYWTSRVGYLPSQLISYMNALICYITETDVHSYLGLLNSNTIDLFKKDYEFLALTGDTALTPEKLLEHDQTFQHFAKIQQHLDHRNYEQVIAESEALLRHLPGDIGAYNTWGYALLAQKKYSEAIHQFTKAIELNPYWEYPYNNRGYCLLQLEDLENGFADITQSMELNQHNAYAWRNLGAYYLKTGMPEKALEYIEQAEKMDPKTEMINFYLGQVHLKLGNTEQAQLYLDQSKTLNEHNDSTIM